MKQIERSFRASALILAFFGLLALCAGVAYGQAIDGNIVGTIVDSQGAAVVGADVTATNIATGVVATTKTGSTGDYRFDHLLVGTYRINAKMTGFKAVSENVVVELNKTGTRNFTLTPGAASETIEVSGTPPTIDTTTSQLQTTYESQVLESLPTAATGGALGSGVLNASLLEAGVGSTGGLGAGAGPSIGGQRARENNFTIEGSDNNSKGVTGPLVYVPNDAVANFTVIANQFSPEFGHSAGGQFNQVVKSGTNTIHGMAYEYFQNRNLNAVDYALANQGITKIPRYDNNRFGGQVGGPIKKDKLFYFVNFEYNPVGQATSPSSAALAPTADGWATILGIPGISADNANGFAQFATAPANDRGTVVVNDYQTTPGTPIAHAIPVGVVPIAAPNFINETALVTSGDWNISDKDQLRARYIYNRQKFIDNAAELPIFYTNLIVPFHLVTLGEYHTFSPNIVNEFRVGYTRTSNSYGVPGGDLGKFQNLDAFPNLTIDNLGDINVGPDPNAPQYATENTYQIVDNFSWNIGKHALKFGIDLRKQIDPQLFIQRARGDYDWSTLDGFVNDFMPDFGQRSFGSVGYSGDDKFIGWYVNDIWKITRNLSLNLGVRYEYLSAPKGWEQQSLNAIANDPNAIPGVCCTFSAPHAPKKDFMPRIGFAYSPGTSGNTSIRGGFAMGYDVLFDNIGTLSRPPQIGSTVNCPDTGGLCHATGFLANGGIPPQNLSGISVLTRAEAMQATSSYLFPNMQYPYAESWNFGIQHVFGPYTAEVRYVGSRGVHLDTQNILNFNTYVTPTNSLPTYLQAPSQAQLDALAVTLDGPGGLLDQSYYCVTTCYNTTYSAGFESPITAFAPWGWSTYHSLQTQVQRRLTNGLQFRAAWTWSHEIDNSTADFFSTIVSPRRPQDFKNLNAEKANGLLDHAHRVTIQVSYDVPWFAHDSNWFKKNLLGNYQFLPVYTYETGQWGTVQSGTDSNLNGDSAPDRAIFNPSGQKGVGSGVTALTNSAGYTVAYLANDPNAQYIVAGHGAYATSSRGAFQTAAINDVDIAAIKHFKFGERYEFDFMAQSFNLFNHPQFVTGSINDVKSFSNTGSRSFFLPASKTFGQSSQNFPSNARTMSLALKFSF
jgi:Carboxypeptidase regulatory-like domain